MPPGHMRRAGSSPPDISRTRHAAGRPARKRPGAGGPARPDDAFALVQTGAVDPVEPLRAPSSLRDRVAAAVRRLRRDPGTANLHRFQPLVAAVDENSATWRERTDGDVDEAARAQVGLDPDDDDDLTRYLAVAREAARRRLGLEPYPEQLLAAVAMLRARVIDMATGEGKTLVGFLVAAGLALSGRGVHVLSANEYLAGRDAAAGRGFFDAFGLSAAAVAEDMTDAERRAVYGSDIVYATVHQIGFDLLRDRRRTDDAQRLLPPLDMVVIDEIDAVLVDDAVVPLVIAGRSESADGQLPVAGAVGAMTAGTDYEVDDGGRSATFTDAGVRLLEDRLGLGDLYATENIDMVTAAHVALHAQALVRRDVDYVVTDGRVRLIDDARGRVAERQRWPDGLHAAIERKEGVAISAQAEVLDQILVETVVRGYRGITGMSGSALEAAERFAEDLELHTGVIGTHRPSIRVDEPDRLHATGGQRDAAAAERVRAAREAGQPVLIGTASVADSERFAALLADHGPAATVLNAKNDADEAATIARAGERGAVTVSTQIAGRGVDIRLSAGAADAGGLLVLGLRRYDSPRLDRQLQGRSGRQGDPGRTVFYTSLEDPLVTENVLPGRPPRSVDADGLVRDRRSHRLYGHAQRVAEGALLQLHRTSRAYHTVTDNQRLSLLATRESLLTDPSALDAYIAGLWPDDPNAAARWAGPQRRGLALEVVLYQLDRAWTRHMNRMVEVREGIHLRRLGRQDPVEEFTIEAADDFRGLADETSAAARAALEHADGAETGIGELGLRRPTSTWTYLVAYDASESDADRAVAYFASVRRAMLGR